MLYALGIVVTWAIMVGFAFILSRSVPSMPNNVYRFMLLFVLFLLFSFALNYVNVWAFGYHKIGWAVASIGALLLATFTTFFAPEPNNTNRP